MLCMSRGGVPGGGAVVLDVAQLKALLTRTFSIGLDVGRSKEKVALVRLRLLPTPRIRTSRLSLMALSGLRGWLQPQGGRVRSWDALVAARVGPRRAAGPPVHWSGG